jgi:hypothetical protein
MICLMDDRISSMDGSLVAGLFIEASFNALDETGTPANVRLIRHKSL